MLFLAGCSKGAQRSSSAIFRSFVGAAPPTMAVVKIYEHQSMASPAAYFEVKISPADLENLILKLGLKESNFQGRGDMALVIPPEAPWFDVSTLGWPIHQFEVL
jgi:hypothetical protein